jgi:hypothetical protein
MVAESASILKRFYFLQRELVRLVAGWEPGTATWEFKLLLPEIAWEDALIAQQLRDRVLELRYPDRRIVPGEDGALLQQWRAFRNAPDGAAFASISLPVLKTFLRRAYAGYIDVADALNDGPTIRILRQAVADIDRQLSRLAAIRFAPHTAGSRWHAGVTNAFAGLDPLSLLNELPPTVNFDWSGAGGQEFTFARRAVRDPRFIHPLFAWPDRVDNTRGPGEGLELQLRAAIHHVNEVWAAEMAAAVLYEFMDEAPPEFLAEGARWCYDEIRHCRMGYSRLLEWGFRPEEIPLDTFSYDASAEADGLVRLGTIFYFETTYIHTKSERAKIFTREGDRLSAHDMDFDWADELIHTFYGSRWLKHFIEARRDARSTDRIKSEAQECVRAIQKSATPADRAETESIYRTLLARGQTLASGAGRALAPQPA